MAQVDWIQKLNNLSGVSVVNNKVDITELGKECKGKTIYAQCALAWRVRQNLLADGKLTSSPHLPPPYTLWRTHRPPL